MKKPGRKRTFKCWVIFNHKGKPLDVLLFKPPPPCPAEAVPATLSPKPGKKKK
jgi:hypothetical protein